METIPGAIPSYVSAKDRDGKEYACPEGALRNPEIVAQEEKDKCELMGRK